jgi:hypothetical protein
LRLGIASGVTAMDAAIDVIGKQTLRDNDLVDVIIVYKIDRMSRSLYDFVKLMDAFEKRGVTFVSVTKIMDKQRIIRDACTYGITEAKR